jgi:hypothetical protein
MIKDLFIGPRASGKTTRARAALKANPDALYFDYRTPFRSDLVRGHRGPIIIDEFLLLHNSRLQQLFLLLDHFDFYLYSTPFHPWDQYPQPLVDLLQTQYPEYFI